ncbi:MAG: hypothetical protein QNI86_13300 [Halieaceae bacterium]|nr:hypothetical protein [Halieaceae bacterium]
MNLVFSSTVRRYLLALPLCLFSAGGHCNEKLERLIQLAGAKEGYESFLEGLFDPEMMLTVLPESDSPLYPLTLEQNQQTEMLIRKYLSWEAVRPGVIHAYEKTYTDEELDYLLELLQDERGRSILSKTKLLEQHVNSQLLPLLDKFNEEFTELNDSYEQKRERLIQELKESEETQ